MDVTIIIPTYNRRAAILETLRTLAQMNYPRDCWEVVVVDDGSSDGTAIGVQEWCGNNNLQVQYLWQENSGAAAARNHGAWEAKGRVLIFIDNDILVSPDFIQRHLDALTANPGCWILGRIVHPPEIRQTPFGRYRDDFHESFQRAYPANQLTETNGMSAANVSLPKADFEALQGFDESFPGASCEDYELGARARQRGIRVLFHPGIVVVHNDWAVSLEQFCRRQKLYSIPLVLLWRKYGEASPWATLVHESAPINWREDSPRLVAKKTLKLLLSLFVGERLLQALCRLMERCWPDTKWSHRAYDLAVAIAIFRGVREGWKRFMVLSTNPSQSIPVEEA